MTAPSVPGFLVDWARSAGPDRVLSDVRSRLERGRLGPGSRVSVDLSVDERRRVGQLLAASWASSGAALSVQALRRGLAVHGASLEDLLVAVGGPLRDLRSEQQDSTERAAARRAEALAVLRPLMGVEVSGEAARSVDVALARWVLRTAPPLERAAAVSRVVTALPTSESGLLLAVLAANVLGDAHALDRSRPLGRAVARLLAVRATLAHAAGAPAGDADDLPGWVDPLESAEAWRQAWASGGIACDSVSSQVLVLNLPLVGEAPAVGLCEAAAGEPLWLTLRSVTGSFRLRTDADVFVCENPSILESAADRLGVRSAPLVCTFGRPGLAAVRLLRTIGTSSTLRVRADGDRVGWGIVASLRAAVPSAVPWRMPAGTTAYEEEMLEELIDDLTGARPRDER